MKKELRVLMVEDTAQDAVLIHHALRKTGLQFRSRRVESREAFLHELEYHPPDVILSDHGVPGFDGLAALAEARSRCPDVPFLFVTGAPATGAESESLKGGADDYILKADLDLLAPAIERALRDAGTRMRQRQLEMALCDAEEQLKLLAVESREFATFMLDADGRIASWNPRVEEMLGLDPGEVLGRPFEDLFSPEAVAHGRPRRLLEAAMVHGRSEASGWHTRKNGQRFQARVALVSLIGRSGKTRGFVCIIQDRTAHVAPAEDTGTQNRIAQWESAHREMEEFTHAIALDLREPLRHIESFSELLNKSAGDKLDPRNRGYLKTISESVHRMSRLIDDLFSFSRVGRVEMHRLHLSLKDIVKEVLHDLRHEAEGRNVEWILRELPEAVGDPVLLWLVFTNLLSNALKFTRPRAQARIEIGNVVTESEIIISVRDNGVGFDAHCAKRLFGVFQRLHGLEFEGTGVGLANVRRIIERHGGRTWAEGVEGQGATFYFSLPKEKL